MGIEYIFNQVREFEEDDYKAQCVLKIYVMDEFNSCICRTL